MGARLTGPAGPAGPAGLAPLADVRPRPAGAILAGGRSARFGGTPKGLLEVGGMRMIDRVAAALRPLVDEIVMVSSGPDAGEWLPGSRVVRDVLVGGGSAAGIHAALVAMQREVLVVAWDMPFATTRALRVVVEMTRRRDDEKTRHSPSAVVPSHPNGMLEPLCALYRPACIESIATAWERGDRSAHGIVNRVHGIVVPASEFATFGGTAHLFFNVNTPAELERARQTARTAVADDDSRGT